jgi:hypothetical protein
MTETVDNLTPREKAESFLSLFEKILTRCYKPELEAFHCALFAVEEIRKNTTDVDYWHAVWNELHNINTGISLELSDKIESWNDGGCSTGLNDD